MREAAGTIAGLGPEVAARHDASAGQVTLTFAGGGSAAVTFTATDACAPAAHYTYTVRPGESRVVAHWGVAAGNHWYDITETSSGDTAYRRRFAGHVSTNGNAAYLK